MERKNKKKKIQVREGCPSKGFINDPDKRLVRVRFADIRRTSGITNDLLIDPSGVTSCDI